MTPTPTAPAAPRDPWAAFRIPDFRMLQSSRALNIVAFQMMGLAVAQDVYTQTNSKLNLGLIGLYQFVPSIAFALFTGHAADKYSRRLVMQSCQVLMTICMLLVLALAHYSFSNLNLLWCVLFLIGTARAFQAPAGQALMPQLVPKEVFSNAVTWSGSIFNISTIAGPSAGGLIYGFARSSTPVYVISAVMMTMAVFLTSRITDIKPKPGQSNYGWESLSAGIKFVWNRPVVFGAISLDLFAVLLGGAVALLPVYANDILKFNGHPVGSFGLGFLRATFAFGAVAMGFALAHMPPLKQAGRAMFASVAAFGLFTILFGVSTNFWLTLFCLFVLGAVDMVSVVVRHTMVQLATPDEMRGRVSAVNMIFIGASNELGEFESGVTAHWFGTVAAVVIGGLGTLGVTALWAWWFPQLREFKRLDDAPDPALETEIEKDETDEMEQKKMSV